MQTQRVQRTVWCAVFLLLAGSAFAQFAPNRYAIILEDPPVAARFASKEKVHSAEAQSYRGQVARRQRTLRVELARRHILVTGSVDTLLNAVFVVAPASRVAELKSLPGVKTVVPMRRYHLNLNRATQLLNAPAAWTALGGLPNAGAGVKIAIIDSGIDQTHPAFQDSSLAMPPGFPKCSGSDCNFTSNKVIVARSYVRQLAAGTDPNNPAADSRPDDYSPRDRGGHGTAVASCAAGEPNTGAVTFNGMAPKAWLGNYKIYGSPEVNDFSSEDVAIQAVEDALKDGMDIASVSSGSPAFSGPLDTGAACGSDPGVPCDLGAQAFENAAKAGLVIAVAAGNDGENGNRYPTLNSIETPADAPSVLAVGAITNSHTFVETVRVDDSSLEIANTDSGDAAIPPGAVTAPLVDVTQLGNDGLACSALPGGSLANSFALIQRGSCNFSDKMTNAQNAGAAGVIFYMADQSALAPPGGLSSFDIPAVMISNSDGMALKNMIDANPGRQVTIDAAGLEQSSSSGNQLASFSSFGPSTGDTGVKPDLVAVGTSVYMAAQNFDPLGELYSSNRYAAADGTSFSTPLVAGAAALVKQNHPGYTAQQIKSALLNTAAQDVLTDDMGRPVTILGVGAGKVDAGAAVSATVTSVPASVSFGALKQGSSVAPQQLQITNSGSSAVNLTLAVAPANQSGGTAVALDQQSLSLPAGASGTVKVSLATSTLTPGSYAGAITIQGGGNRLRVPYLYVVGDGVPANMIPLTGAAFDGTVNQVIPDGIISFKLVDTRGAPVAGVPVTFTAQGGGSLQNADSTTDRYGIAAAQPTLGSQPGSYSFTGSAGGLRTTFSGTARLQPHVPANGVANAASFDNRKPVAPGSYISIFGTGLSDTTDAARSVPLPLAIDFVNVSFDVPSAGISVPGRLIYVSPGQLNVQVPWELQGQSAAQMKVTIDFSAGNVVSVPLAGYAPAFFETSPGSVAALDGSNQPIGAGHAAQRGQMVQLYANGLGPVTNQPASGDPASASNRSETTSQPVVTIGGQAAAVSFSGLAPGFPGLYQVNVTVPANVSLGNQLITVAIGGQTSPASGILVQ